MVRKFAGEFPLIPNGKNVKVTCFTPADVPEPTVILTRVLSRIEQAATAVVEAFVSKAVQLIFANSAAVMKFEPNTVIALLT